MTVLRALSAVAIALPLMGSSLLLTTVPSHATTCTPGGSSKPCTNGNEGNPPPAPAPAPAEPTTEPAPVVTPAPTVPAPPPVTPAPTTAPAPTITPSAPPSKAPVQTTAPVAKPTVGATPAPAVPGSGQPNLNGGVPVAPVPAPGGFVGGGEDAADTPAQNTAPKSSAKPKAKQSATPTPEVQSAAVSNSGPDRGLISTIFGVIAGLGTLGIGFILLKMRKEKQAAAKP